MERAFSWDGQPGEAVLRSPGRPVRAGLVTLHGASDGRCRQPLFDQLGAVLDPLGVAVLSYDRRSVPEHPDTPLDVQATDAVAALRALTDALGSPVGLFGFSQGAWAATVAAAEGVADFLIVLGSSGVSPAAQMRYHVDELLRRNGFTAQERAQARRLRLELERYLRRPALDALDRERLMERLRTASRMPWFQYAYLPTEVRPGTATWPDMDFDPAPSFAEVDVPVLAMWGADEECVPRDTSRQAWRDAGADITLVDLPGCGHWPVVGSGAPSYTGWETDEVSAEFTDCVTTWLSERILGSTG